MRLTREEIRKEKIKSIRETIKILEGELTREENHSDLYKLEESNNPEKKFIIVQMLLDGIIKWYFLEKAMYKYRLGSFIKREHCFDSYSTISQMKDDLANDSRLVSIETFDTYMDMMKFMMPKEGE